MTKKPIWQEGNRKKGTRNRKNYDMNSTGQMWVSACER